MLIALATLAAVTSAWSSGGFIQIDATNMPGWYRFDIPNAALATGKRQVVIEFLAQPAWPRAASASSSPARTTRPR